VSLKIEFYEIQLTQNPQNQYEIYGLKIEIHKLYEIHIGSPRTSRLCCPRPRPNYFVIDIMCLDFFL